MNFDTSRKTSCAHAERDWSYVTKKTPVRGKGEPCTGVRYSVGVKSSWFCA